MEVAKQEIEIGRIEYGEALFRLDDDVFALDLGHELVPAGAFRDSNRREAITSRSNSQQDRRTEQKKGKLSSHRAANLNTQSHFGLKASPQEMRM
jgi:hypothetical protein